MTDYNPFSKEIGALEVDDLGILRTVHEGWYVEYKAEAIKAVALAKSVSAFANSLGGWLFIGVAEKSKAEPVAGAFPGIAEEEVDPLLQRLRQGISTHVTPCPHYEVKVLRGPNSEIGLQEDRAVVVVRIPWSTQTPFVHSSGLIYRRLGDGAEPKPETDRFVLDQLWRRSGELEASYKQWIESEPEFSKGEEKRPYLRLFLTADLWRDRDLWTDMTLAQAREAMSRPKQNWSIPFDAVHAHPTGFVARQVAGNDPTGLGLTWWLRHDLRSEILIPINTVSVDYAWMVAEHLEGYEQAERFQAAAQAQRFEGMTVLDLNMLYALLAAIMATYHSLLASAGWDRPIWAKAQFLNVWRAVPFLDLASVVDDFADHHIPVCLHDQVFVFPGYKTSTFIELTLPADAPPEDHAPARAASLFQWIGQGVGVHWPEGDGGDSYFGDLLSAFERARARQEANLTADDN